MTNQPLTASFTAPWVYLTALDQASIMMAITTSANNGQFFVDVSNDPTMDHGIPTPVIWDTLMFNNGPIPPLSSINEVISVVTQLNAFSLFRVRFVAGTVHTNGVVTAYLTAKGV